jgi:hypothetical protein
MQLCFPLVGLVGLLLLQRLPLLQLVLPQQLLLEVLLPEALLLEVLQVVVELQLEVLALYLLPRFDLPAPTGVRPEAVVELPVD